MLQAVALGFTASGWLAGWLAGLLAQRLAWLAWAACLLPVQYNKYYSCSTTSTMYNVQPYYM